jgi:hypothetical protein
LLHLLTDEAIILLTACFVQSILSFFIS